MSPLSRRRLAILCGIMAAGVALRMIHYGSLAPTAFPEIPTVLPESDMATTLEWATQIQSGDILGRNTYYPRSTWMLELAPMETWYSWWGSETIFYWAPLYAYLVAALLTFLGHSLSMLLLAQLLIGSLQVLVIFYLARRLFNDRVALVAAALSAFYGPLIFYQGTILRDWLVPIVESLSVVLLLRASGRDRTADWLLAGGVLGLALLTKKTALLLVVIAAVWMLWNRWRTTRSAAYPLLALMLGLSVMLSPLMIRNALVGAPILAISNRTAEGFIYGNAADIPPVGFFFTDALKPILERSEGQIGGVVYHTLATYQGDWGRFLRSRSYKLRGIIDPLEVPNNLAYAYGVEISPVLRWTLSYGLLFPLGMAGLALSFAQWRQHSLLILHLFSSFIIMMSAIVLARYRLVLIPALSVYAAFGIVHGIDAIWKKRRSPTVYVLLLMLFGLIQHGLVPVGVLRQSPFFTIFPTAYNAAAMVYMNEGRFDRAVEEILRLRERAQEKGFKDLVRKVCDVEGAFRIRWSERLWEAGEADEAKAQALRAEAAFSGGLQGADTLYSLGMLNLKIGETKKAATHLERFLEGNPKESRADSVRMLLEQLEVDEHGC